MSLRILTKLEFAELLQKDPAAYTTEDYSLIALYCTKELLERNLERGGAMTFTQELDHVPAFFDANPEKDPDIAMQLSALARRSITIVTGPAA